MYKINYVKLYFKVYFILIFFSNAVNAQIINNININGNKRISEKTIEIFSKINLGQDYNKDKLNEIFKNLYNTDFFETIEINIVKDTIIINVIENTIIEDILIEGLKSSQLTNLIKDSMKLKSRKSYLDIDAQSDQNLIKKILKERGYYFSRVETKTIKNDAQNTIRIIYDIEVGERAKIKEINLLAIALLKIKTLDQ